MDQIKPPKNLILSRESMNAALDALRAGRSVKEATQEVARTISARTVSKPLAPPSSRAPKPSTRGARSARSPSSRSSSAIQPPRASRSQRTFAEGAKKAPKHTAMSSAGAELARADSTLPPTDAARSSAGAELERVDSTLPSGEAPEGRIETPITEEMAPGGEARVILVDEDVREAAGEDALVIRDILAKAAETKTAEDALPQKESSGVPEEVSGRMDITHQSPASVVAEVIRERMFGGITAASDPRLLALSGLLASSTQEQVAFRARSKEDLGNTARELLLMVTGIFMEMDARDRALREFMDRRIEEARLEENLSATSDARGNLAAVQEDYRSLQLKDLHTALEARKKAEGETAEAQKHAQSLEAELSHARRVLKESDERAAAAEVHSEEVLKQLSSTVDALRERDEAVSQKEEVQRQHEQLKVKFDAVLAQKSEAVARVVVLKQELSKQADSVKGLTLAAEESKLQNQQLCQQVKSLETRCSALLEGVKLAEDRVQLEVEKRLREYKESPELKKEIQQAGEAYLQNYKNSLELKAEVAEACERRLAESKASDEMKTAVWNKGFRMFVSGFN
ncbi:uncharacterized abhydrolase domain-containing protein DDB_G0269086-like [Manihot esculenta]|uniref:uncharacterized abhydrolase domain-containing protein DDB_G0269086-like n=1 Tax=Manihot esculenta TaxID=3983 RepID=UPI000B5D5426|nr:uncharacterized abhydrolase domain-containing protein DDB_G0269086-like [Manihot esculenta]